MDEVRFELDLDRRKGCPVLTPWVNGVSLVQLVGDYEAEQGFDVVGGYDGLLWGLIKLRDLSGYLLGEVPRSGPGRIQLLACDCGEWGCWPLEARFQAADGAVTWDAFLQPHRPSRDYSGFGPFTFDDGEYRAAVQDVVAALARDADPS